MNFRQTQNTHLFWRPFVRTGIQRPLHWWRAQHAPFFQWQYEYELVDGYLAPWGDGSWSPAGVVGEWKGTRRRLCFIRIPVGPWRAL